MIKFINMMSKYLVNNTKKNKKLINNKTELLICALSEIQFFMAQNNFTSIELSDLLTRVVGDSSQRK